MKTANRGEWSEIYAFFRLLADQQLYAGNRALERDLASSVSVINVAKGLLKGTYENEKQLICIAYDGKSRTESRTAMDTRAKRLLSVIKSASHGTGSFSDAETSAFLASIGCATIKASSKNKKDMEVTVKDTHTGTTPTLGFSVKSYLGSAPTLLNASKATRFQYKVTGLNEHDVEEINAIDGGNKYIRRAKCIQERATTISFNKIRNPVFMRNLQLLDDGMPNIAASLLLGAWLYQRKSVADACEWVAKTDPQGYGTSSSLYGVKVRRLLRAVALGMIPATPWTDRDDATGGYIVVRPDGELVAFYIYNRATFDDYLFSSTIMETPSGDRYEAMSLYYDKGEVYIDLCLDIRFAKKTK